MAVSTVCFCRTGAGQLLIAIVLTSCSSPDRSDLTRRLDLESRWDRAPCDISPAPDASLTGNVIAATDDVPCAIALRGSEVHLDISAVDPVLPVVLLSTGELAAITSGRDQVAIWNDTGQLVRLLGQRGEGPGEFRQAVTIYRDQYDTLYVFDAV